MKTKIFYFSGTGNSLSIAKKLASHLGDTELVSIPEIINSNIDYNADRLGIVFPVYAFGCPLIIEKFLEQFKPSSDKYVFAMYNSAGMPGAAGFQTASLLARNGVKISAMFSLKMPGNYIPFYGAISEEKQQKIFMKTDVKIQEAADFIAQNKTQPAINTNCLLGRILSFIHKNGMKNVNKSDKNFHINEKCIKCGLCSKVCPVNNIKMGQNGTPEWLGKCEQCMACLQWCPTHAIGYGKISVKRKRYHHPEIKADEMIISPK